jgi:threonine-phosphate decarboxylase
MIKKIKLVDGSSGASPLGPSRKVKAAIRKAAKCINTPPVLEMERLRRLYRSKFGIASENLLIANSLRELLYLVAGVLNPEKVVVVGPAPETYEDAASSAGAEVIVNFALDEDYSSFDSSGMREIPPNADFVLLSNPNRITGRLLPREKIHELIAASGGAHFIIDEALMEFTGQFRADDDLVQTGKVTVLRSTALFYGMAGLELAFAVSSSEMIQLYDRKAHWNINLLSIEAARAAYRDSSYIRNVHNFIERERCLITRALGKMNRVRVYDTDTNVLLVKTDEDPDKVSRELIKAGLDIRNCGRIKGLDSSFFSVAVMKHEDNLNFISTFKKMDSSNAGLKEP